MVKTNKPIIVLGLEIEAIVNGEYSNLYYYEEDSYGNEQTFLKRIFVIHGV